MEKTNFSLLSWYFFTWTGFKHIYNVETFLKVPIFPTWVKLNVQNLYCINKEKLKELCRRLPDKNCDPISTDAASSC